MPEEPDELEPILRPHADDIVAMAITLGFPMARGPGEDLLAYVFHKLVLVYRQGQTGVKPGH